MVLRAVVFDVGGTLIKYPPFENLREVCQVHGTEIIESQPKILMRMYDIFMEERKEGKQTLREALMSRALGRALWEFGVQMSYHDQNEVIKKLYILQHQNARLFRGAVGLLRAVKALDLKVGLISNTPFPAELQERDLRRFRISSYFDVIVWSSRFRLRKPHPDIFREALRLLRVFPQEAIYIGDQFDRDIEGPQRIGMEAILIDRGGQTEILPALRVNDLREVIDIIKARI